MTVPKKIFFFSGVPALLLMVALFFFVFNPLGLGPEPATVLPPAFFANPAQDLSELELLVDGKKAFNEIFAAIDSALVLTVNNSKETEIRTATVEIIENATRSVVIINIDL